MTDRPGIHRAWLVVGAAMCVVLGAVGLARFAFGIVLPAMASDLGLNYAEQGMLGASYFAGYLAVVSVMPWLAARAGSRLLCTGGLVVVGGGLAAMSLLTEYVGLLVSYGAVGVGSGAAFIGAMSLPSLWFHPSHRGRAAGVATAGAGLGIAFSGFAVPPILTLHVLYPWQVVWILFALLVFAFALIAGVVVRDRPADLGLTAFGHPSPAATRTAGAVAPRVWPFLCHLGAVYTLFAATMLTYTTFVVTSMVESLNVPVGTAGYLWAAVGGLSILSGPLFGALSDRLGHRAAMLAAMTCQALAHGLLAVGADPAALYASIVLFGLSAWSMPSIVAAAVGDHLAPDKVASGFAVLTLMFAVGQVVGPASAGLLAQITGSFLASYAAAVGLNIVAVVVCLFLPRPARRDA